MVWLIYLDNLQTLVYVVSLEAAVFVTSKIAAAVLIHMVKMNKSGPGSVGGTGGGVLKNSKMARVLYVIFTTIDFI